MNKSNMAMIDGFLCDTKSTKDSRDTLKGRRKITLPMVPYTNIAISGNPNQHLVTHYIIHSHYTRIFTTILFICVVYLFDEGLYVMYSYCSCLMEALNHPKSMRSPTINASHEYQISSINLFQVIFYQSISRRVLPHHQHTITRSTIRLWNKAESCSPNNPSGIGDCVRISDPSSIYYLFDVYWDQMSNPVPTEAPSQARTNDAFCLYRTLFTWVTNDRLSIYVSLSVSEIIFWILNWGYIVYGIWDMISSQGGFAGYISDWTNQFDAGIAL
eukprot:102168_1